MYCELTEEQQLVRASVREFREKYVEPLADAVDQEARFPSETLKRLAEQDWLGIPYPEEYGGAGADYLTYIIAVEELSPPIESTLLAMRMPNSPKKILQRAPIPTVATVLLAEALSSTLLISLNPYFKKPTRSACPGLGLNTFLSLSILKSLFKISKAKGLPRVRLFFSPERI